jgi:hypothetical protein
MRTMPEMSASYAVSCHLGSRASRGNVFRHCIIQTNKTATSSYFFVGWGGVRLSPLGTSATNWPIVPAPDDEYGVVGGTIIGRGNQSTGRKPAPVPLCLPQQQTVHSKPLRDDGILIKLLTFWTLHMVLFFFT